VFWLQKGISDMIIKEKTYEYKLTLDELAQEIWDLDDIGQCKLLDKLYNITDVCHREMQLEYLSDRLKMSKRNNKHGMEIIDGLYERVNEVE
jgi:hypothetical protein